MFDVVAVRRPVLGLVCERTLSECFSVRAEFVWKTPVFDGPNCFASTKIWPIFFFHSLWKCDSKRNYIALAPAGWPIVNGNVLGESNWSLRALYENVSFHSQFSTRRVSRRILGGDAFSKLARMTNKFTLTEQSATKFTNRTKSRSIRCHFLQRIVGSSHRTNQRQWNKTPPSKQQPSNPNSKSSAQHTEHEHSSPTCSNQLSLQWSVLRAKPLYSNSNVCSSCCLFFILHLVVVVFSSERRRSHRNRRHRRHRHHSFVWCLSNTKILNVMLSVSQNVCSSAVHSVANVNNINWS